MCVICFESIYEKVDVVFHSGGQEQCCVSLSTSVSFVEVLIDNVVPRRSARLKGFSQDLHLVGQEFNTLLSILYVGYILMQIPS